MLYIALVIGGYLVGVFLNRAADALTGNTSPFRASRCTHCGAVMPAAAQWGGLAGLLGKRACEYCGVARSWRYPAVEAGAAAVFALLGLRFDGWQLAAMCVYFAAFILVTVTDMEHRAIFDAVTLPATVLALAFSLAFPKIGILRSIEGAALGFVLFLVLALIARKREGMGGGDVTLAGFIGAAVGFPYVIVSIVAAILAGGLGAIALLITRRAGRDSYMPYGPFLVIGGIVGLLAGRALLLMYFGMYAQ